MGGINGFDQNSKIGTKCNGAVVRASQPNTMARARACARWQAYATERTDMHAGTTTGNAYINVQIAGHVAAFWR
jgi:hypothetical protein